MKASGIMRYWLGFLSGLIVGVFSSLFLYRTQIIVNDASGEMAVDASFGPISLGQAPVPSSLYYILVGKQKSWLGKNRVVNSVYFGKDAGGSYSYSGSRAMHLINDFNFHAIEILSPEQREQLKAMAANLENTQ